jgi:PPOX class probable F420-dependent enzyme
MRDPVLSPAERAFLSTARRAVLATIASDGRPRLVPICFALDPVDPFLYTPLDEKPKAPREVMHLARVRDVLADPRVSVLVDRWDEDWERLAWLRCHGTATVLESDGGDAGTTERDVATTERDGAISALRARYPQYVSHRLEARPMIRIVIEGTTSWGVGGSS